MNLTDLFITDSVSTSNNKLFWTKFNVFDCHISYKSYHLYIMLFIINYFVFGTTVFWTINWTDLDRDKISYGSFTLNRTSVDAYRSKIPSRTTRRERIYWPSMSVGLNILSNVMSCDSKAQITRVWHIRWYLKLCTKLTNTVATSQPKGILSPQFSLSTNHLHHRLPCHIWRRDLSRAQLRPLAGCLCGLSHRHNTNHATDENGVDLHPLLHRCH